MKPKKSCSNCLRGTNITINSDILCSVKGAVTYDYVCSKHKFAPESKTYRDMNFKCIHCENFILNINSSNTSGSIGLCQLFSVRQFDGNNKSACSKFVKRAELEVS